jgi:polyhydroxybutyrate depolymerase
MKGPGGSGVLAAGRFALVLVLAAAAACSSPQDAADSTTTADADCTPTAKVETGTLERTIDVAGEARHYLIVVPTGYDGTTAVPVVLTIHGFVSSAQEQVSYTRWGDLGEAEGFLVVAPNARQGRVDFDFLAPATDPASDAAFLDALMTEVQRDWCVDPDRTYATGFSNGSATTFGLACRAETPFAAFGSVAGAFYDESYCGKAPATSYLYFHGTADGAVPYRGGTVGAFQVASAAETMAAWAKHDGCGPSTSTEPADDVELVAWSKCDDGSEVGFYTIAGGGHTWPGAAPRPELGATTDSIDATALMWAFFQAHPRQT